MITVQDILEIPDLNLRLLAGAKSTSNPVRWVHITEVPDPTKWLKGGELLLTTGYGFVGPEEQQVASLQRLIDHNISGLGFGTGFSFDKVPPALVKVAEEYGVSSYTKQRLQLLKIEINSLFKNDKAKQTGLADFM